MSYICAIDQGTTGTRALLINKDGSIQSSAYSEFKQIYPQSGWVEHDAEEIWQTTVRVVKEARQKADATDKDIAAIGITNQRETTLIWDKNTGRPIHNAIVWQCRRTGDMCDRLKKDGLEPLFQERTGLVLDAYFSGTKIKWLLDHVQGARERARRSELLFGTIDSWLVWNLTGGKVHITDMTNASRTLLFNIHEKKWDEELLEVFDIPAEMMPEVQPSLKIYGETDCELFDHPVPIAGMAGDQQAALYGQNCWEPGMVKNTYGTGCFIVMNTGQDDLISQNKLLTTIACDAYGQPCYALEGAVFIAGAVVQWLRDELHLIEQAPQTDELAASVADTGGVYIVPAFVGLGAPYWDQNARGTIVGLTRGSGRSHIVRAALESIAYQSADVIDAMRKDSGLQMKELRVDGGACENNFLMQFQSDILNINVERPAMIETTAMGAAFLAGLAVDFWTSPEEIAEVRQVGRQFAPQMSQPNRLKLLRGWHNAVKRTLSVA